MCRHTGYLGPAATLEQLLVTPAHGLARQAFAPRRQRHGTMNADGFGVGWWDPSRAAPARYRRAVPIWADPSFGSLAGVVRSTAVLAAVRSATAGTPPDESACAPFLLDAVLLSHNGRLSVPALAPLVDPALLAVVGSTVDSGYLAALVLGRLRAGERLPAAVAGAVCTAGVVDPAARLNVLAGDGRTFVATTWGDTLGCRPHDGGGVLASEPPDDAPGWRDVPDRSIVTLTPHDLTVEDL